MPIFKAIVRTKRKDGFYQVYIRCVHNRKPGYIKTDKLVTDKQVDTHGEINDPFINEYCAQRILEFTQRLNRQEIARWTVKQVIDFLATEDEDLCFSDYARLHIDRMLDRGQIRNARNYELALRHLERYAGTTKIMFSHLTSTWVNLWIKELEPTARAKELYPVCLRQVFREAIRELSVDNGLLYSVRQRTEEGHQCRGLPEILYRTPARLSVVTAEKRTGKRCSHDGIVPCRHQHNRSLQFKENRLSTWRHSV